MEEDDDDGCADVDDDEVDDERDSDDDDVVVLVPMMFLDRVLLVERTGGAVATGRIRLGLLMELRLDTGTGVDEEYDEDDDAAAESSSRSVSSSRKPPNGLRCVGNGDGGASSTSVAADGGAA